MKQVSIDPLCLNPVTPENIKSFHTSFRLLFVPHRTSKTNTTFLIPRPPPSIETNSDPYSFRGKLKLGHFNSSGFSPTLGKLVLRLPDAGSLVDLRKVFDFFSTRGLNNEFLTSLGVLSLREPLSPPAPSYEGRVKIFLHHLRRLLPHKSIAKISTDASPAGAAQ